MVHEVFRTEELAERQRAHSVDHAGFEVEDIRTRYVHAVRGTVVKQVDEVELRAVVAAVLAVAPGAALVAQNLLKRGANMVTAPARQYMNILAHRTGPSARELSRAKKQPEGGEQARERGRGGVEKRKKICVAVSHGKQEMQVVRARVSWTGN
jgi:hypothetical protein